MVQEWVPFGLTEEEQAEYQVLVPGLPDWLREPIIEWLRPTSLTGAGSMHRAVLRFR